MEEKVQLKYNGNLIDFPLVEGTQGEKAIDIQNLRAQTGLITLDRGFKNTGSCTSAITFLDGEKGILRYRGYDIAELAEKVSFFVAPAFVDAPPADLIAVTALSRALAVRALCGWLCHARGGAPRSLALGCFLGFPG